MKEVYPEYHQEKWLAAHGDPGSPGGDPERRFQGDVAKEAIRAQMLAARLETEKRGQGRPPRAPRAGGRHVLHSSRRNVLFVFFCSCMHMHAKM